MMIGNGIYIGRQQGLSADALAQAYIATVEADGGVTESESCLVDRINTLKSLGLWDKASAVWLPHGYKEGKLYAAKGGREADLGITRAGTRTRKGPSYVEQVPYNALSYSQDLSGSSWSKGSTTVSANAIAAPDGTITGDKLIASALNAEHYALQSIASASGAFVSYSVYLKAGEKTFVRLRIDDGSTSKAIQINVNLSTGAITQNTNVGSTVENLLITDAGSGWYKLSVDLQITSTTSANRFIIYILDSDVTTSIFTGNTAYLGDGASGIYVWRSSVVIRSLGYTDHFKTTNRQNVPALDYTNDTCPALSLEPARTNLLLQSEDFSTTWTLNSMDAFGSGSTVNAIAGPDGLTTADKLQISGIGGHVFQTFSATATTYTLSYYLKQGNAATADLGLYNFTGAAFIHRARFTWATKSIVTAEGAGTSGVEELLDENEVATGWYRVWITGVYAGAVTARAYLYPVGAAAGANDDYIYAVGAQCEAGSYATSYIPTSTATVSRVADAVSALYPKNTNLALHSEDWSNAVWTKDGITVTTNATTDPNGTSNADRIVETATGPSPHRTFQQITTVSGKAYCYSVYAKAGERTQIYIQESSDSGGAALFNLVTGEITGTATANAAIESIGDGWYRCSLSWIASDTTAVCQIGLVSGGSTTYTGNGTSGAYIWGAQFQIGSTATTYLPTTTVPVHDGSVIGQTEGTLYAEVEVQADSVLKVISLTDGTDNNAIWLYTTSGNLLAARVVVGGVIVVDAALTASAFVSGQRYKMAVTYNASETRGFCNGVKMFTDTSTGVPVALSVFAVSRGGGSNLMYGNIYSKAIFKTALTDAQAIAATA